MESPTALSVPRAEFSDLSEKVDFAGEETNTCLPEMPMISIGGAAVQGAVWNGEHGKLPGPFRGSHGKDVENEEIQPFLVAAWRHSVVGGDRLQPKLHNRGQQLRTGDERCAAYLRWTGLRGWPSWRSGSDDVFTVLDVSRHGGHTERFVLVLIWGQQRLCAAEHGLTDAAGNGQHSLMRTIQTSNEPEA